MNVFGQTRLYSCKVVVFGKSCCIPAKWLYLAKSGCIGAIVVVFGHKLLYFGKVVVFE